MFGWINRIFSKAAKKQERPFVNSAPRVPPAPPRRKPIMATRSTPSSPTKVWIHHGHDDNFTTGILVGAILSPDRQEHKHDAPDVTGHGGNFGGGGASGSWDSSDSSSSSDDSGGDSSSCDFGGSGGCGD